MNASQDDLSESIEGMLLLDKPKGRFSFSLVTLLRKHLGVRKIGHAGTLDPFATGLMVMLIGRRYTRLSDRFLGCDKEYLAEVCLGISTDTHDVEGTPLSQSSYIPSPDEIALTLQQFQGEIDQIPPMYSAKKRQGKKLYELARQGIEIERAPIKVTLTTECLRYAYPYLDLRIRCTKGTYIRSIAHELGEKLGCGAHLTNLRRTRSGNFKIEQCIGEEEWLSENFSFRDKFLEPVQNL